TSTPVMVRIRFQTASTVPASAATTYTPCGPRAPHAPGLPTRAVEEVLRCLQGPPRARLAARAEHDAAAVRPARLGVHYHSVVVAVQRGDDEPETLGEQAHSSVDIGEGHRRPDRRHGRAR